MRKALSVALVFLLIQSSGAADFRSHEVAETARYGFEEILDLWRGEEFERLFSRLDDRTGKGWGYFAGRMVYASRVPACCWEKLQDVTVTVITADEAVVRARVGFEVEGVGTRFVTRDFSLRRIGGVWTLPLDDVLELSDYNLQRIPRRVYERTP